MNEEYYRKALKEIAVLYAEKRTDVEEICTHVLEGKPIEELKKYPEHRYVKWMHNGVEYEYDTLTTLVSYYGDDGMLKEIKNINYEDDCS